MAGLVTATGLAAAISSLTTAIKDLRTDATAEVAALQAEATITVDAGSDGTTARPVGWGHVRWIVDNGVTLDNALNGDSVDEREA